MQQGEHLEEEEEEHPASVVQMKNHIVLFDSLEQTPLAAVLEVVVGVGWM